MLTLVMMITWLASRILLSETVTVTQMYELKQKLMETYDKHSLPFDQSDNDEQFDLGIYIHPIAIADLDEINEDLSSVLSFMMDWNDTSIRWKPDDHHGIGYVTFGLDQVWKPGIWLGNPHQRDSQGQQERSSDSLTFTYTGTVEWTQMITLHSTCDIITTYFPFDVQKCDIELTVGNEYLPIRLLVDWTAEEYFKGNGAWDLVNKEINVVYSVITLTFEFARKPMFMILNVLMPMIVLVMLTPLVFLMSKGSGERIGFSVTMLLSLSVYMTIINEHLPMNSEPMPLVSVMIFLWYVLTALIVLIVICNIKISRIKDGRNIPKCLCTFVKLTRCMTRKKALTSSGSSETEKSCIDTKGENEEIDECKEVEADITWMEVSVAIDKWCFVIFYVIKFLVPAAFIAVIAS